MLAFRVASYKLCFSIRLGICDYVLAFLFSLANAQFNSIMLHISFSLKGFLLLILKSNWHIMEKHVRSLLQCSLNSINNSRRKENKTHTTFGAQGRAVIMHFGMKLCLNKLKQDIIVYIIHSPHSVIWWES